MLLKNKSVPQNHSFIIYSNIVQTTSRYFYNNPIWNFSAKRSLFSFYEINYKSHRQKKGDKKIYTRTFKISIMKMYIKMSCKKSLSKKNNRQKNGRSK